jgi:hypothetical protein
VAGQHDQIGVRIFQPELPVVRAAFLGARRVPVLREDDLGVHIGRSLYGLVKIIDFKPQKDAIAIRPVVAVSNRSMVMVGLKAVELQHEVSSMNEPLVHGTAMLAAAAEQLLIPAAACFDVSHGN